MKNRMMAQGTSAREEPESENAISHKQGFKLVHGMSAYFRGV